MNRLQRSNSVYLKQHEKNPVHWWSWSPEAFAAAKADNRLVLVSIGYSTCHWCHVMEHECFEDMEVADALNSRFVCIKVDREEHPEVDRFYMDALLKIQGHGGWPLNMFVLPDGKPIVGGTYFPKKNFLNTLDKIHEFWISNRETIEKQAQTVIDAVQEESRPVGPAKTLSETSRILAEARQGLITQQLGSFDPVWGGYGRAPKFPRSHGLGAMLRAAKHSADEGLGESAFFSVLHTLKCMAFGGLRDHLGGGFHRYSTDEQWLAPHFEKMLYDQALLIDAYSEAYAMTDDPFFRDVVNDIFEYCRTLLRQASGLYGSGEDADSEGVEGKFYVWSLSEIENVLAKHPAPAREKFLKLYAPTAQGNWEGSNILRVLPTLSSDNLFDPALDAIKGDLFQLRSRRPRPILDPKAIVEWNSLLALGFLRASFHVGRDLGLSGKLAREGQRILQLILEDSDGDFSKIPRIFYPSKTNAAPVRQGSMYLVDAAALALALQYGATLSGKESDFTTARKSLEWIVKHFKINGQWKATRVDEGLQLETIDEDDGATPSALSLLAGAFLRGARLFEDESFMAEFLELMPRAEQNLQRYPVIHSFLLSELDGLTAPLVKCPANRYLETVGALSKVGFLLSEVIVKNGASRLEICGWQQCDWTGDSVADLTAELQKRRADRLTDA